MSSIDCGLQFCSGRLVVALLHHILDHVCSLWRHFARSSTPWPSLSTARLLATLEELLQSLTTCKHTLLPQASGHFSGRETLRAKSQHSCSQIIGVRHPRGQRYDLSSRNSLALSLSFAFSVNMHNNIYMYMCVKRNGSKRNGGTK